LSARGHRPFLHRLKQRGLGLWWRSVDLVGENQVAENRTVDKFALAGGRVGLQDFGAGDVRGHQVGGELDPVRVPAERAGECFHQQGFGESGNADEQRVPFGKQGDQQLLDDLVLAEHHRAQAGL